MGSIKKVAGSLNPSTSFFKKVSCLLPRLGFGNRPLPVFGIGRVILRLPARLRLPEPALALVTLAVATAHSLALTLWICIRHGYQSNPAGQKKQIGKTCVIWVC